MTTTDPRRTAAARLAASLASDEGLREARRRQAAGLPSHLDPPHPPSHPISPPSPPPSAAPGPPPISIWQPLDPSSPPSDQASGAGREATGGATARRESADAANSPPPPSNRGEATSGSAVTTPTCLPPEDRGSTDATSLPPSEDRGVARGRSAGAGGLGGGESRDRYCGQADPQPSPRSRAPLYSSEEARRPRPRRSRPSPSPALPLPPVPGPGPGPSPRPPASPAAPAAQAPQPPPTQVWRRPPTSPLGDHYATRRDLHADRPEGTRRVLLFGESAAAGYLYAPHLTPARILEAQLREVAAGSTGPGWEVVDLARTNERCATLAATAEAAEPLHPDHLVVFTGNNWTLLEASSLSPWTPSVAARLELAAGLASDGGGIAGAVAAARLARRRAAEAGALLLERLAAVAARTGATVTLVVPEVNLDDWETRQPPVRLPGDGTGRWFAHHDHALAALARRDWTAAEAAAWAMVELDGGTGPTPFRLLQRALRGRAGAGAPDLPSSGPQASTDLLAAARDAARSEIDATHYPLLAFLAAPQAGRAAHGVLVAGARRHGFATVDLRTVLAAWTGSSLPGRRLFLDYCHLGAEGMAVAMAAVAAELLLQAGHPAGARPVGAGAGSEEAAAEPSRLAASGRAADAAWRRLLERLAGLPQVQPSAAARATAHLGAAVHTAHRHLPVTGQRELLEHHARLALEADSEGAAAAMLDLAEARTAALPELLTAAHRRNGERAAPLLLQHGWRWPHLDGDLLRALAACLEAEGDGRGARGTTRPSPPPSVATLHRLLLGRRRVPAGGAGVELVHPPHALAEPLARFFPEATAAEGLPPRALLRCPWPEVGFDLVLEPGERVEVEIVLRRPESARPAPVRLTLGGSAATVEAGPSWSRRRAVLEAPGEPSTGADREALPLHRLPLHRLTLRWPPPEPVPTGADPLAGAVRRLEAGRPADLHPVLGEVTSLRVRARGRSRG